jgi:long-chain acyl-CoA synthetase
MNVGKTLRGTAARLPDKKAIIYGDRSITFKEVDQAADRIAGFLLQQGISKGDRVGIIFPNIPEFAFVYFGVARLGAVGVPLDIRLKGGELTAILQDAAIKAVFITETTLGEVGSDLEGVESLECVVIAGKESPGYHSLEAILRGEEPVKTIEPEIDEEEEAVYLYTSGTTGKPKGVVLTFRNLDCFPLAMKEILRAEEDDVVGFILPVSHISGPIFCNHLAFCGSTLCMFEHLRPDKILESIDRHGVNYFHAVPPIFQSLLRVPHRNRYKLKSLSWVALMGTSVPVHLIRQFKEATPWVKVIQGYGLTETSPLITLLPLEFADSKIGSIGVPVPEIRIKIADTDEKEVAQGEVGEIAVKGPVVMKGYHNNAEATEAMIREGWLYTGDLGSIDEEGFVYHLGRKDDLIITGGFNVFPAEVENVLLKHPDILEAGAVGVPDKDRGQIIKAAVVSRPGKALASRELKTFCREHLADYKVPKRIEFRDVLPKTSTGKVSRRELA